MGRKAMPDGFSTYYPPRERWYGALFYLGQGLRRRLALDRLTLPDEVKPGALLAGFFVPGLAVCLRGPKLWGQAAMVSWATLALFYTIRLGWPAANFAFGMMISIHSTGLVYYCNPLIARDSFRSRIGFTLGILLALILLLYLPARGFIQQHWLSPLRWNGRVIVVQRIFQTHNIQRGEWVAYTLQPEEVGEVHNGGAVWFHGGAGFGPVLAVAGDRVIFSTTGFSINGSLQTNQLPHMPSGGAFIVKENHWFIWPNLAISGHGNVSEADIANTMLSLADVSEKQFLGKPMKRWFWRKQILP